MILRMIPRIIWGWIQRNFKIFMMKPEISFLKKFIKIITRVNSWISTLHPLYETTYTEWIRENLRIHPRYHFFVNLPKNGILSLIMSIISRIICGAMIHCCLGWILKFQNFSEFSPFHLTFSSRKLIIRKFSEKDQYIVGLRSKHHE